MTPLLTHAVHHCQLVICSTIYIALNITYVIVVMQEVSCSFVRYRNLPRCEDWLETLHAG